MTLLPLLRHLNSSTVVLFANEAVIETVVVIVGLNETYASFKVSKFAAKVCELYTESLYFFFGVALLKILSR